MQTRIIKIKIIKNKNVRATNREDSGETKLEVVFIAPSLPLPLVSQPRGLRVTVTPIPG
jgi:hypothetical protein